MMAKCRCCNRKAEEIPEIIAYAKYEGFTPDEFAQMDGTYTKTFDTFVCTDCYLNAGAPSIEAKSIKNIEQSRIQIVNECRKNTKK